MKNLTYVIYQNQEGVFVTTSSQEKAFRAKAKNEWGYNLDPDDGDFERYEISGSEKCVRIGNLGYSVD